MYIHGLGYISAAAFELIKRRRCRFFWWKIMGGGRKNLKRAVEDNSLTLKHGQCIMQVLSLQGSNQIGVHILC